MENVNRMDLPKFVYAGFFIRLCAYIIDIIIVKCIYNVIFSFANSLESSNIISAILYNLVLLFYFAITLKYTHGQSVGKILFGIRVISIKDDELSWDTVITREIFLRYIQNKIFILYILCAFNPQKQNLGDMFSDTVVVKNREFDYFLENKNNENNK